MTKKLCTILFSLLAFVSANAFAQEVVEQSSSAETRQGAVHATVVHADVRTVGVENNIRVAGRADGIAYSETVDYSHIHERSGMELSAGLGFGGAYGIGFGGHIAVSYDIFPVFAFGVEVGGNWSSAPGVTAVLVPKLLVPSGKMRFTFGLGLGYGGYFSSGGKFFDEEGYGDWVNAFALKPELQFDWFVDENWFVGFGIDWVAYLSSQAFESDEYDDFTTKDAFSTLYAYFHLGYKF